MQGKIWFGRHPLTPPRLPYIIIKSHGGGVRATPQHCIPDVVAYGVGPRPMPSPGLRQSPPTFLLHKLQTRNRHFLYYFIWRILVCCSSLDVTGGGPGTTTWPPGPHPMLSPGRPPLSSPNAGKTVVWAPSVTARYRPLPPSVTVRYRP